ncbi:MAG: hypothetical protein M2R45_00909 [Verrucomicrobia subdivision 3 bacterium]|nr:hypothetical protein [Limisphaerales bacterium]MCS1414578.1 hypothetical protein [Limisphaerales bacterium]
MSWLNFAIAGLWVMGTSAAIYMITEEDLGPLGIGMTVGGISLLLGMCTWLFQMMKEDMD